MDPLHDRRMGLGNGIPRSVFPSSVHLPLLSFFLAKMLRESLEWVTVITVNGFERSKGRRCVVVIDAVPVGEVHTHTHAVTTRFSLLLPKIVPGDVVAVTRVERSDGRQTDGHTEPVRDTNATRLRIWLYNMVQYNTIQCIPYTSLVVPCTSYC